MYKKITEDVSSRQEDLNVAGYQLLSYWQKIVFSIPSFWKNALFNKPQFCTEESFSNWRKGLIALLLWNGNDSHDFINIFWVPMVNPVFCEILSFSLNFPFKGLSSRWFSGDFGSLAPLGLLLLPLKVKNGMAASCHIVHLTKKFIKSKSLY